jgi:ubiquinone/menaquinone biosynthesis C-methylase UbiE
MNGTCLAFPDNHFDFVYSSHALEQMESIIDEAISKIVRVMKHRAVLIEPVLENGSLAQRRYLKKWGYVQSLLHVVQKQQNVRIVESFSLGIQGNPLNQSSLIVLEKLG